MNDKNILKLSYAILIILVCSALYYGIELLPSVFSGEGPVIESGNIKLTPAIFVEHMLSVTIIDAFVAILAILTLRNAINLNKKTHDSQGKEKSL